VLRALLEGLCFELEANLRILDRAGIAVEEIRAAGGGAKNLRWLQLKADVFNRPVRIPKVTEAGCLGAALLACAAGDKRDIESLVAGWVQLGDAILPDPERADFYRSRFAHYEEAYRCLRALSEKIF
jgi:xylulokinase